jgi:hypothetical protein
VAEPVIVLPGGAGRTFIESGLIAFASSHDRLFGPAEVASEGDWMNAVTLHHEWVHFVQSITCASVHWASQQILHCGRQVLAAAAHGSIPPATAEAFREAEARVYAEGTDERVRVHEVAEGTVIEPVHEREHLDMLDVMEGVAVLESFRLCTQDAGPAHFTAFLERHFPGQRNRVYRRAFDLLEAAIGADAAFELLPGVAFVALQSADVTGTFMRCTDTLAGLAAAAPPARGGRRAKAGTRKAPFDFRALTDYPALVQALGRGDARALPHAFVDGEPAAGHPCLDPCAALAVRELGLAQTLQVAAFPHRVTPEHYEVLRAPLMVCSGEGRTIVQVHPGLGEAVHRNVLAATSLVGAALRLVESHNEPPYQFCPHRGACPHHSNALCHRQFAPPRESRRPADCGFPKLVQAECGMDPSQLWAAVGHGAKTPAQLLAMFDETFEAGILALCRAQRGSLTTWLGDDGYQDIEWQCEVTAQKALKALQTQKIDDAIEARMFRDAVVRTLHRRAGA